MALLWECVKFEAGFTGPLWCCSYWGVSQEARQRLPRVPASLPGCLCALSVFCPVCCECPEVTGRADFSCLSLPFSRPRFPQL